MDWITLLFRANQRNLIIYDDLAEAGQLTPRLCCLLNRYYQKEAHGKLTHIYVPEEARMVFTGLNTMVPAVGATCWGLKILAIPNSVSAFLRDSQCHIAWNEKRSIVVGVDVTNGDAIYGVF